MVAGPVSVRSSSAPGASPSCTPPSSTGAWLRGGRNGSPTSPGPSPRRQRSSSTATSTPPSAASDGPKSNGFVTEAILRFDPERAEQERQAANVTADTVTDRMDEIDEHGTVYVDGYLDAADGRDLNDALAC